MSLQSIFRLWDRLTEPTANVTGSKRQNAKFMASLLLALSMLMCSIIPLQIILTNRSQDNTVPVLLSFLTGALLLATYKLIKRGKETVMVSAMAVYATFFVFSLVFYFEKEANPLYPLYYFVLINVFVGMFLPVYLVGLLFVLQIAGMLLLPALNKNVSPEALIAGPMSFTVLVTLFAGLFIYHLRRLEYERRQQLSQSEERYRLIMELSSDYAFSIRVEPDGRLIREWTTESFTNVTGYDSNEGIGSEATMHLFHPDDYAKVEADVARVLQGETITSEYRILTRSGEVRWVQFRRRPVWDAQNGRVVRYLNAVKDVTDNRRIADQKLRLTLEHERMDLMSQFVAAMSHDFRTSLSNVETGRYLIQRRLSSLLSESDLVWLQDKLDSIRYGVTRMTEQLDNLGDVSSLTALHRAPHDLNTLVDELVEQHMPVAAESGLAITFTPAPDLPVVNVDETSIMRALHHLLVNAQNYTSAGGKIMLRTYAVNRQVAVEVADTGIGIRPENLAHVFDLFYREDAARPIASGGMGLGLSIVKIIAEAHGGSITAQSTQGEGSIFTLLLPVEEAPVKPAPLISRSK